MAGTITGTFTKKVGRNTPNPIYIVLLTCTADSGDGSYPITVINTIPGIIGNDLTGLYLYRATTKPGVVTPTSESDLTITDENNLDILGGSGTNLISSSIITSCVPRVIAGSVSVSQPIASEITLNITNNSVNSAVFTLELLFTL